MDPRVSQWPKRYVAHLNGWAEARDAARDLGLDFTAERRLTDVLNKLQIVLQISKDGSVKVVGDGESY